MMQQVSVPRSPSPGPAHRASHPAAGGLAVRGEYRSIFEGSGMEFAEVREYLPVRRSPVHRLERDRAHGEAVRQALHRGARADRHARRRPLGSSQFGTVSRFKSEMAIELAAVLTMSAVRNNDRVGVLLFTDRIEHVVPPAKGRRHALRIIRDVLVHEPEGKGTDVGGALGYRRRLLPHRSIVFVISGPHRPRGERPLSIFDSDTMSSLRRWKIRPSGRSPTSASRGSSILKRDRWSVSIRPTGACATGSRKPRTPNAPRASNSSGDSPSMKWP